MRLITISFLTIFQRQLRRDAGRIIATYRMYFMSSIPDRAGTCPDTTAPGTLGAFT
jgi:hypothetical protein